MLSGSDCDSRGKAGVLDVTRTLALLGCVAGLMGCASTSVQSRAATAPPSQASAVVGSAPADDEGPAIDWDHPIVGGLAATSVDAAAIGGLSINPHVPSFGRAPVFVQVTDPAKYGQAQRGVAYVFHFPASAAFPRDGRVRVLEQTAPDDPSYLQDIAANPPGDPGDFSMITVNGVPALLVQANGIGRVQFIRDGILYDITGPAVSPAEAIKLAGLL